MLKTLEEKSYEVDLRQYGRYFNNVLEFFETHYTDIVVDSVLVDNNDFINYSFKNKLKEIFLICYDLYNYDLNDIDLKIYNYRDIIVNGKQYKSLSLNFKFKINDSFFDFCKIDFLNNEVYYILFNFEYFIIEYSKLYDRYHIINKTNEKERSCYKKLCKNFKDKVSNSLQLKGNSIIVSNVNKLNEYSNIDYKLDDTKINLLSSIDIDKFELKNKEISFNSENNFSTIFSDIPVSYNIDNNFFDNLEHYNNSNNVDVYINSTFNDGLFSFKNFNERNYIKSYLREINNTSFICKYNNNSMKNLIIRLDNKYNDLNDYYGIYINITPLIEIIDDNLKSVYYGQGDRIIINKNSIINIPDYSFNINENSVKVEYIKINVFLIRKNVLDTFDNDENIKIPIEIELGNNLSIYECLPNVIDNNSFKDLFIPLENENVYNKKYNNVEVYSKSLDKALYNFENNNDDIYINLDLLDNCYNFLKIKNIDTMTLFLKNINNIRDSIPISMYGLDLYIYIKKSSDTTYKLYKYIHCFNDNDLYINFDKRDFEIESKDKYDFILSCRKSGFYNIDSSNVLELDNILKLELKLIGVDSYV